MKLTTASKFLVGAAIAQPLAASIIPKVPYQFAPETSKTYTKDLPYLYDVSASQLLGGSTTSYWTCSFLSASDNHQYLALSINMWRAGVPITGGIVVDVTDPSYVERYTRVVPDAKSPAEAGQTSLNASIGTASIIGVSSDNVSKMRTKVNDSGVNFDLTYTATSQILFQGSLGYFALDGRLSGEWAIPSARTEGSIVVRGKKQTVDPKRSFTWYDRQWSAIETPDIPSGGANYTWFQLTLPKSGIKASIWAIDYESGESQRIATFRYLDGTHTVLPYEMLPDPSSIYVSLHTNTSYPTKYTLNFPGRGTIKLAAIRKDQEVWSGPAGNYEGFAKFTVDLFGVKENGFGILEIIPALVS